MKQTNKKSLCSYTWEAFPNNEQAWSKFREKSPIIQNEIIFSPSRKKRLIGIYETYLKPLNQPVDAWKRFVKFGPMVMLKVFNRQEQKWKYTNAPIKSRSKNIGKTRKIYKLLFFLLSLTICSCSQPDQWICASSILTLKTKHKYTNSNPPSPSHT